MFKGGVFLNIKGNKHIKNTSSSVGHYMSLATAKQLSSYMTNSIPSSPIILCIGTDRCIGDALGPITGSILKKSNPSITVYGTIENPIHALNISSSIDEIKKTHPDSFIVAVDASLGSIDEIGNIIIRKGPLYPGKGVGKKLPAVGDLSIIGIVADVSCDIASTIHNIRLHFIISMAEVIANIIIEALTNYKIDSNTSHM